MSSTTKIVLSGYYGFDNIGDEAVLYSIISVLRKELGQVQITVLSNNPEKTKALYGVESINRWKLKEIAKVIKESDLLISGGGSLLQDVTSGKTVPYYLAIVKIAQFYKKKVVFYSQGIGPVNKSFSRWLIKVIVNKVDGIYVRDLASKKLLEEIGIKKPVEAALDPVLGIEVPKESEVSQSCKTVGVYIRPWQDESHDQHMIKSMLPGLLYLMEQGYKICLIPMHYEQDLKIARDLAKAVKKAASESKELAQENITKKIEVIDKMLSIKEVLAYTASFEMVIGMRLHSLIMAAASRVPMVALSYDPKVTEFMNEMELNACLDTNSMSSEDFLQMVKEVEESKEEQIKHLNAILEKKSERIYLPVKKIKQLV